MTKDNNSTENFTTNEQALGRTMNSDLFFSSLFEYNSDIVLFMDNYGVIAKVNKGFCETLGYSYEESTLSLFENYFPSSEVSFYQRMFQRGITGDVQLANTKLLDKSGKELFISLNMIPARVDGRVTGIFVIAKDITKQKESEMELAETELKFSSIVDEAIVGVYIVKKGGEVIYGNRKFYEILGTDSRKLDINFHDYIHPDDIQDLLTLGEVLINGEEGITHTYRIKKQDGTVLQIESHSAKIYLQNTPHMVATLHDITENKKAAELNEYLANHDYLTGLPNKRFFYEKLDEEQKVSRLSEQKLTVMILDLDRFKYINDSLGHTIGDKLLKEVALRLKENIRENDFLARDGGDEFAILLPNFGTTNKVIQYAKKLIQLLEEPFVVDKYELFITASIGISIFPTDGEDSETLIKHADSALYKAKDNGKNTYQIFTSSMNTEAYKLFTLESDLRRALDLKQLELYYQPQINAVTNEIVGAEALIRWNHPEWGVVSPNEFIPLAEETGMIIDIGRWIKQEAFLQNKAWQDMGLPEIPISINLSANRFLEKDLFTNIRDISVETELDPKYLQVEIVETSLLENEKVVISVLKEMRKLGIKVLLDDFGTGYSSLSYLRRFKGLIDILKIDKSFIDDLSKTENENSNFITKTIIELANHLEMDVIAEGVETTEQLDILKEYKCKIIQGYLFSKPVPAEEFGTLLKKGSIELPIDNNISNIIENRRKYFRIKLDFPLSASMSLIQIYGRKVELGKTEVLIEDIGLGGLRFLSDLRLPVQKDVLLEFETEILGEKINLYGQVVWLKELKYDIYQYGLEYSIGEDERSHLAQVLNKLAILLRKNPLVPDCSFVKVSPASFFKEKSRNL